LNRQPLETKPKEEDVMNTFQRATAVVLAVCTLMLYQPLPAQATMIATEEIAAMVERDTVKNFLNRDDVRANLERQGVSADQAKARVDKLTDAEVKQIAGEIDALPAGGDVLGVVFTVFIILLITDILGFTSVFPFTRPIR
jgi:hypothetical protein